MTTTWHVPCLRGVVGDWVYYSVIMNAEQIATRIMDSKEIREAKALDDYLQRDLKPRVNKIAVYLRRRDSRFFSSIVLGVFDALPDWIELDFSAVSEKLGVSLQDIEESLGLLIFHGGEKVFAIDGQHRVEGIKRAVAADPDRLTKDEYPALLVAHIDNPAGKVRTRRLFCDINKNAVAVSEGDKVVIDEDDLPAIVTRRIYAHNGLFSNGEEIAVTGKKEQLLYQGRERFTSLLAIYTVCKRLKKLYKKPRGVPENDPANVKALQKIASQFFDFVVEHERSLNRYFVKKTTTLKRERENNRNLFFRPVGLEVLARLYVHFSERNSLATLQYALEAFPFRNPGGVFDGILWNVGRIEASGKARKAAVELCLYLLDELPPKQEAKLKGTLREVTKNPSYDLPPKLAAAQP